jgi:hypothetical protein
VSSTTAVVEPVTCLLSAVVPSHRLGRMPDRVLLFTLHSWVLLWLDHYHAATRQNRHHLLRIGAPAWMLGLVRLASAQLNVSPRRLSWAGRSPWPTRLPRISP